MLVPDAVQNKPYSVLFSASDGTPPYSWAIVPGPKWRLPAGKFDLVGLGDAQVGSIARSSLERLRRLGHSHLDCV